MGEGVCLALQSIEVPITKANALRRPRHRIVRKVVQGIQYQPAAYMKHNITTDIHVETDISSTGPGMQRQ